MFEFHRRDFLKALALFFALPVQTLGSAASKITSQEAVVHTQVNYETFHEFVKDITASKNLDEVFSLKIYKLVINESWENENLKRIIKRFNKIKNDRTIASDKALKIVSNDVNSNDQWFISHLLLTFYTGVYYHASGNEHVSLEDSLMYQLQSHYRKAPTYCSGQMGFWSEPPVI